MQLLREPRRERVAAGVCERVPDRMPHLRRSGRPDERGRADRKREATSVRKPRRGRSRRSSTSVPKRARFSRRSPLGRSSTRKARCCCARWRRPAPDPQRPGDARVDYDTPHVKPWGLDMAIYLLTKGIATGAMLLSALLCLRLRRSFAADDVVGPAHLARLSHRHRRRFSSPISNGPNASTTSSCARTGGRGWSGARIS